MSVLEQLEKLYKKAEQTPQPKPPQPKPVQVFEWEKLYKESEKKRHALVNANKKLLADTKRYERLGSFILDGVDALENRGENPLVDVPIN